MPEPDRSGQRSYWDNNLDQDNLSRESHRRVVGPDEFYCTPEQILAVDFLDIKPGQRLLEVGVGLGENAWRMSQTGGIVFGIDISGQRLSRLAKELARMPTDRIFLVQCAVENLPFRNGVFDAAYSKSVLIHTRIDEAASELHRVLAKEGRIAFIEPMTGNPLVNLYRRTLAPQEWISITRYFDEERINQLSRPFAKIDTQYFYMTAFLAFVWQYALRVPLLFSVFLNVFHAFDLLVSAMWPGYRRYAWFAVMCGRK